MGFAIYFLFYTWKLKHLVDPEIYPMQNHASTMVIAACNTVQR